jgi:hypothetical protein
VETEKWKNMFACDAHLNSRSTASAAATMFAPSPTEEVEKYLVVILIPLQLLSPGSSSNGSGELPKPKLMTYLRSILKKKQSKSPKFSWRTTVMVSSHNSSQSDVMIFVSRG